MGTINETRLKQPVGTCPACGDTLEVVLAVTLVPGPIHVDTTRSETKSVVEMSGEVVGAVSVPHDCMPKPGGQQPRTQGGLAGGSCRG